MKTKFKINKNSNILSEDNDNNYYELIGEKIHHNIDGPMLPEVNINSKSYNELIKDIAFNTGKHLIKIEDNIISNQNNLAQFIYNNCKKNTDYNLKIEGNNIYINNFGVYSFTNTIELNTPVNTQVSIASIIKTQLISNAVNIINLGDLHTGIGRNEILKNLFLDTNITKNYKLFYLYSHSVFKKQLIEKLKDVISIQTDSFIYTKDKLNMYYIKLNIINGNHINLNGSIIICDDHRYLNVIKNKLKYNNYNVNLINTPYEIL